MKEDKMAHELFIKQEPTTVVSLKDGKTIFLGEIIEIDRDSDFFMLWDVKKHCTYIRKAEVDVILNNVSGRLVTPEEKNTKPPTV